ncbi:monooxygenase [Vanrija albida]|uniref:Monooxygenase n=1 Tax=Vanrija albida TaxID=181172 RepID=A0ABR3PZR9_9TREE
MADADTRALTRIAVIGAGASGLAQIAQLKEIYGRDAVAAETRVEIVGFEARDGVGGIWWVVSWDELTSRNYDPNPSPFLHATRVVDGKTQLLPHPRGAEAPTPVYDGLRTNLAGGIMQYRGFPFPDTAHLFPTSAQVLAYLQSYAEARGLLEHIRFNTRVERLRLTPSAGARRGGRRWGITSSNTVAGTTAHEEFDYVAVANGHYADGYIPPIEGLSGFPGTVQHSREFRREADYAGRTVLVVGSFASGSDVSRLIAQLNVGHYAADGAPLHAGAGEKLPFTKVYQSSSGVPNINNGLQDGTEAWKPFVVNVPLIERVEGASAEYPKGRVHFYEAGAETENGPATASHAPLDDVDVIIFATGYYYALPFIKAADAPWDALRPLEDEIARDERAGGAEWETGGLRGWAVRGLDPLLLFLENDRTIVFNVLQYQIAPFPFAEVQARLAALLWAGLLPNFPDVPTPPPNLGNPYIAQQLALPASGAPTPALSDAAHSRASSPPSTPPEGHEQPRVVEGKGEPLRHTHRKRKEFIFPNPYEVYWTEYVFSLTREGEDEGTEDYWLAFEQWRADLRNDVFLRKRTLGY